MGGDHPEDDLSKFGYKQNMCKVKAKRKALWNLMAFQARVEWSASLILVVLSLVSFYEA
jgi:hypothetical protein